MESKNLCQDEAGTSQGGQHPALGGEGGPPGPSGSGFLLFKPSARRVLEREMRRQKGGVPERGQLGKDSLWEVLES